MTAVQLSNETCLEEGIERFRMTVFRFTLKSKSHYRLNGKV